MGRPSVAEGRRRQIVEAFIDLVGETGSTAVTMSQVSERSGVHRSAIRHFVGNRGDLISASVDEICRRHNATRNAAIGDEPTLTEVVDHYFSDAYIWENAALDNVFGLLLVAAVEDEQAADSIAEDYRGTVGEIVELLGRDDATTRTAAYQVVCLAEQNVVMQRLGFDAALNEATRRLARELVERATAAANADVRQTDH